MKSKLTLQQLPMIMHRLAMKKMISMLIISFLLPHCGDGYTGLGPSKHSKKDAPADEL